MLHIPAWVGHFINLPAEPLELDVYGSTSRGIFLVGPGQQVIFLSYEPYRGPLTVNLEQGEIGAYPGEVVRWKDGRLRFQSGSTVHLAGARRWQPPDQPTTRLERAVRYALLVSVTHLILESSPQSGLTPILNRLFDLPASRLAPELDAARGCLDALRAGVPAALALQALLGLGRGLTPAGDDCAAGYLLARARTSVLEQGDGQEDLVTMAYTRTTTLSARLIEAASHASADERLVQACDGLISGNLPATHIQSLLKDYGSSSGSDSFVGMAFFWIF